MQKKFSYDNYNKTDKTKGVRHEEKQYLSFIFFKFLKNKKFNIKKNIIE